MAHFAKVNVDNIVEEVLVVPDEQEHRGEEYLNEIGLEGRWIQTSYNGKIRTKLAAVRDIYNAELDRFEPPRPYPSWLWNEEEYLYEAPTENTSDAEGSFVWDEETLSWIILEEPEVTE